MSLYKDINRFTPRKEQVDCLEHIKVVLDNNPTTKFFLLNLPVGTGKSHLAMMFSDYYLRKIDKSSKIDIVTASKILQDQYEDEYVSISNLKGKENYSCPSFGCSCMQGKEFAKLNKKACEFCPYDDARNNWINSKVSLTNFYLYLIYSIYNEKLMDLRGSNVLIVDEAHELDSVISDFISIKITENTIKRLKFADERGLINKLRRVNNIPSYIQFLQEFSEHIASNIEELQKTLGTTPRSQKSDKRTNQIGKVLGTKNPDMKLMNILNDLSSHQGKIELFLKEWEQTPDNWVLETNYNEKTRQKELSLEPIWSQEYLNKYLWSKYDVVILMSGTIIDKGLFCEINGIDAKDAIYYSIPSPFEKENRKIYYLPSGKMSWDKKEETFKNYVRIIPKLLDKYSGKKGIIHTNSFELSQKIMDENLNERLLFHDSDNKNEILTHHFTNGSASVLVSPSMSTGVSFDGDKARFQIVAKIPYPSLASQKNKMRKQQNPDYYAWKTCCGLIQMCGRIVRSHTDFGDTVIIDSSFSDVLKYSSRFLPEWFTSSVISKN
jgi:Rad3-related DNA helicase